VIVVDTNVIAYLVIPGAQTEAALVAARRDRHWTAPALWRHELRNVLATLMRLRGLELRSALAAYQAADAMVMDATVEPTTEQCLLTARQGGVSAYDAEFVWVAGAVGAPLVTADVRLARAFPERAIALERFAAGG
jgi:predicted nucleic acid-binding protein